MVRCIVIGAAGRMGMRIINTIHNTERIKLVGAVESKGHPRIGVDAGELLGIGKMDIPIIDRLDQIGSDFDALIDFTTPESSLNSLEYVVLKKKDAVIGTTGFYKQQTERIRKLEEDCQCVFYSKMSVGMKMMFKVIRRLAHVLQDD